MKAIRAGRANSAKLDASLSRSFVECFDGLVRQLIVPNSHKAIQDLAMGPQDVRALTWLGRRNACLMTDFAKGVGIPLSTATHLANRLVEKGVLVRERSEQDRRVVSIELSKLGRKLDAQLFEMRLSRSQSLLTKLSAVEQQQLVALMQKTLAEDAAPMTTTTEEECNELESSGTGRH